MKKTVCELFAGVGGFRLGLERESKDWKTVWFNQWEPGKQNQWAHACYVGHFGDIDDKTGIDIALVNKSKIPDHNLLVGGFPCQDYSVAKPLPDAKGIEGKKGVLWWQIRDTLKAKKPSFALFENVDRLLKSPVSQRGRNFGVILACLASLGYSAEWRVINAAEYGAAQKRRRVFIFGYKNKTKYAKNYWFAVRNEEKRKAIASQVLFHTGFFAKAFPVLPLKGIDIAMTRLNFKDILDVSEHFQFSFDNAGWMTKGTIFSAKISPVLEAPQTLRSLMEHHVDASYFPDEKVIEKIKYLKSAKKLIRTAKNGYTYNFSMGAVPFPDSIDQPARTLLTSETRVSRSTHIIRDLDTGKLRVLTPVEAERIQGFDSNWTANAGMPLKFRYFCMGNALVVPMITRMAYVLDDIFQEEPE